MPAAMEHSGVGRPPSNVIAERAVQAMSEQARVMLRAASTSASHHDIRPLHGCLHILLK